MLKTSLALTALAVSLLAVNANATPNYTNQSLSTNFTLNTTSPSTYTAGTSLAGHSIQNGTTLNIASLTLPDLSGTYATDTNTSDRVASTIYRQNYSAVIGNVKMPTTGGVTPAWIKDIVGVYTSYANLPTSGTYNYTGKTVSYNLPNGSASEGNLNYSINFNTKKGSGTISNLHLADLPILGAAKLSANLNEANIVDLGGGRSGVSNGNVTSITTGSAAKNLALFGTTGSLTGKYDLSIFGGNGTDKAKEIAGLVKDVTGGGWGNIEIGFAGKQ